MSHFQNRVLQLLDPSQLEALGSLELVGLPVGSAVEFAGEPTVHVHFIESGVASMIGVGSGREVEVAMIGSEGIIGLGLVYGDSHNVFPTVIQIEASAYRIAAGQFLKSMDSSPELRRVMLRAARAFSIQVKESTLASSRHNLDERLARWLLMMQDRCGRTLEVTHDLTADMLGVRRSGVTLSMQALEGRGLITNRRKRIAIVDRAGLIEAANGAYGFASEQYHRLVG